MIGQFSCLGPMAFASLILAYLYLILFIPHRPTTCSWVTMSIAESSRSRLSVSSLPTKSSTPRTFSFCAATTSVQESTGFTDSTMSAAVASRSRCGSNFATLLIVCLAVPSLTIRLFACTEAFRLNSRRWSKLPTLHVLVMSRIPDYCAISSGLTLIRVLPYVTLQYYLVGFSSLCLYLTPFVSLIVHHNNRAGEKMIAVYRLPLVEMLFVSSSVDMI